MTFDQLYAIAERQGTVQWGRSGIIEHLRLSKDKKVIRARPIKQSKMHTIRRRKDVITFNCVEVDSVTKAPIKPTIFDLQAVAIPEGTPMLPGGEKEIAPGVQGVVIKHDLERLDPPIRGGFAIPFIMATEPGMGAVGRFLDSLPRDTWIFFSTVLNPVLEEMLLRRGFVKGQAVDPVHGEQFDVLERLPEST